MRNEFKGNDRNFFKSVLSQEKRILYIYPGI